MNLFDIKMFPSKISHYYNTILNKLLIRIDKN